MHRRMRQSSLPINVDFSDFERDVWKEYFFHNERWKLDWSQIYTPYPEDFSINNLEEGLAGKKENLMLWLEMYNKIIGKPLPKKPFKEFSGDRLQEIYCFVISPKKLYLDAFINEAELKFGQSLNLSSKLNEFPYDTNEKFLQKLNSYYSIMALNNFNQEGCLLRKLSLNNRKQFKLQLHS